jgi:hypothetical protein
MRRGEETGGGEAASREQEPKTTEKINFNGTKNPIFPWK